MDSRYEKYAESTSECPSYSQRTVKRASGHKQTYRADGETGRNEDHAFWRRLAGILRELRRTRGQSMVR